MHFAFAGGGGEYPYIAPVLQVVEKYSSKSFINGLYISRLHTKMEVNLTVIEGVRS